MPATDNSQAASTPTAPSQPPPVPNQAAPAQTAPEIPLNRPSGRLSAGKAFGKPITAQGRTIIPVAIVAAMGTGGGLWGRMSGMLRQATANGAMNGAANRRPGGMRRRMMVRPVGYIDISSTGSRFISIAPGRFVALGVALAFVAGGLIRRSRAKRKANG
ncbi:hypothetical protein [uncultured Hymenobacter sp.]|uniref:hypothetical protein n=1 Tax=uncultured Hymenobacter sp. TaxID=170016 RepID=UPI0035C9B871